METVGRVGGAERGKGREGMVHSLITKMRLSIWNNSYNLLKDSVSANKMFPQHAKLYLDQLKTLQQSDYYSLSAKMKVKVVKTGTKP